MAEERTRLEALADAVADRADVNWDLATAHLGSDSQRLAQNLSLIARLAAAHDAPPPDRWGALEIESRIGHGSFGEVYRARDPQLDRDVALKLLRERDPGEQSSDSAVLREGRLLARVKHPNVVAILGAERRDGRVGVVMEYISGRTLHQIIEEHGALGPEETIVTGLTLCRALGAVHAAGLAHGDLKPQNVMREDGGRLVLMDFGAGRLRDPDASGGDEPVAGTPICVAPEILRGGLHDVRSDIYSLGVVLFYALTRTHPVLGASAAEIADAHARGERRLLKELRPDVPVGLAAVIDRCLDPVPAVRYASAAQVERALADCLGVQAPPPVARYWEGLRWPARVALVAALLLAGSAAWVATRPAPTDDRPTFFRAELPVSPAVAVDQHALAISPTGNFVAYRSDTGRLRVREMSSVNAREVPGSDDGTQPFFSPDGRWLAFFANGQLKRFSLEDGTLLIVCSAPNARGGTWTDAGWIVFAPTMHEGLFRVPAEGGTAVRLTTLGEGEISHRWPAALPGGEVALTIWKTGGSIRDSAIGVFSPSDGRVRTIAQGTYPRYAATGHLLFGLVGDVVALPWTPGQREAAGSNIPVQQGVLTDSKSGFVSLDVSRTGHLVYLAGGVQSALRRLVWVDEAGRPEPLEAPPRVYENPRLSPDGQRIAVTIREDTCDLWQFDIARGVLMRVTFGTADEHETPVWSPDGQQLAYTAWSTGRERELGLWVPGHHAPRILRRTDSHDHVSAWVGPGQLLVTAYDDAALGDVQLVSLDRPDHPQLLVRSPANDRDAKPSPDGQWIAYTSNETGRDEVYVRAIEGDPRRMQISSGGGSEPTWRQDGRALYYRSPDAIMRVGWSARGVPAGAERLFTDVFVRHGRLETSYDVSGDGRHFLMLQAVPREVPPINLVIGWRVELAGARSQALVQ